MAELSPCRAADRRACRPPSRTGYRPQAGDTGTGVLGYSAALSYPINFVVSDVGGDCTIEGVSAFTFGIKAVGLCLLTGRNGGA